MRQTRRAGPSRRPEPLAPWVAALAIGLACAAPGQAQPAAGAAQAVEATPGVEATKTAEAAAQVPVRAFRIEGNTLLDEAQLQAALQPWLGQRTLAELQKAALAVQALYGQAGWGAVVAYLPPQPVADGTVTISVLEGRIGRISVQGNQRQSSERVLAALPTLAVGRTPQVRRIDAELQIANENPARTIGLLLGPGTAPGLVDATVKVQERPVQRFTFALDNTGNEQTGKYRLGLGWLNADLSGRDDVFIAQLQLSPTELKAVQVISAGYQLPLVRDLAAVSLYAAYSDVDGGIQPTAAGDLRFAGKGNIVGGRGILYLPRWGEFDQRLTGALERRAYLNDCSVEGLPEGACGPSGESVVVQPLSLEYAAQTGGAVPAALNIALAHNLAFDGGHSSQADFDAARPGASRNYSVLRAGAVISLPVAEDWALGGRLALQRTTDLLVQGEQFGLGGIATVRGYGERELAGDQGISASLELVTPRLGLAEQAPGVDLRGVAFADGGQVANHGDLACLPQQTRCTLASLGVGLRLDWGPVQGRLYVAQAQRDGNGTRAGDWRTQFTVTANY